MDHPNVFEANLVFLAILDLLGETPPCVRLLSAWRHRRSNISSRIGRFHEARIDGIEQRRLKLSDVIVIVHPHPLDHRCQSRDPAALVGTMLAEAVDHLWLTDAGVAGDPFPTEVIALRVQLHRVLDPDVISDRFAIGRVFDTAIDRVAVCQLHVVGDTARVGQPIGIDQLKAGRVAAGAARLVADHQQTFAIDDARNDSRPHDLTERRLAGDIAFMARTIGPNLELSLGGK